MDVWNVRGMSRDVNVLMDVRDALCRGMLVLMNVMIVNVRDALCRGMLVLMNVMGF